MFNVLSRLTKPGDGRKFNTPAPMSTSLQKKFARGVDYNMKILIKGDRNVGKSCLLQRLQGGSFIEEYQPTDQIQVAPIHWKYKDTEHIIKVEVWEVVDKGKVRKKNSTGLKFDNASASSAVDAIETPALDATFLDVYVNANGVIMMMDITKSWTFEYIKREIESVPSDLPIIILGNHCDMHHHREVDLYQIEVFMMNARQSRKGPMRYAESSMRNGFGLRLLHKFFNIPFLKLQRQTLLNQLAVNDQELLDAFKELDEFEKSEGADYNSFLDRMASKRKQDNNVNSTTPHRIATDKSPSIVLGAGKPIIPPNANPLAQTNFIQTQTKPTPDVTQILKSNMNNNSNNLVSNEKLNINVEQNQNLKRDFIAQPDLNISNNPMQLSKSKENLEDFCTGVLDNNFLDDFSPSKENNLSMSVPKSINNKQNVDSDSDGDVGINPLVVGIQDDLDSTDENENINDISTQLNVNKINLQSNENTISNVVSSKYNEVKIDNQFSRSSSKFSPFNESILSGVQSNYVENKSDKEYVPPLYSMSNLRAYDSRDADEDHYDSSPDFNQPHGYDSTPSWSLDASMRRSPEGGEGNSPNLEAKKEKKSKEEKKHKKSKKSKDGEKSNKKEKDKDKTKDKEKKHREKKHKKKGSDEYLEEFLGGGQPKVETALEAYESL